MAHKKMRSSGPGFRAPPSRLRGKTEKAIRGPLTYRMGSRATLEGSGITLEQYIASLKGRLMDDDTPCFWLAIKGSAVPAWDFPVTPKEMRQAIVRVGGPGEQTVWAVGATAPLAGVLRSNYDVLIGYPTAKAQQKAQEIFLNSEMPRVRAEMAHALANQVIIRRSPN